MKLSEEAENQSVHTKESKNRHMKKPQLFNRDSQRDEEESSPQLE